jgi:hypothetical protein
VTEFKVKGQDILVADESDFPIRSGSLISVTLNKDLYGLDYLSLSENSSLEYLFNIEVDGNKIQKVGNLGIELFYPNTIRWANGTENNLFDFDSEAYSNQFTFPETGERNNNIYVFTVHDRYSTLLIARDVLSGVLLTWYQVFTEGSIRYDFLGHADTNPPNSTPIKTTDFFSNLIVPFGVILLFSIIILITYKKKNWISNKIK